MKVGLLEEFIIHRRCEGGIVKIKRQVERLERELREKTEHNIRLHSQLERERDKVAEGRRMRDELRDGLSDLRVAAIDAQSRVHQLEAQLQSEKNLRALAELQARSTRAAPAQETVREDAAGEISEPVDGTAERFRLLELD